MTDVDPVVELTEWWMQAALVETGMVCAKAVEYSATDLRDLGRQIYEMAGRPQPDDATATEAGIAFYVLGKMGRVMGAIREGRRPSLDTWVDIGVYARMAQRVHEVGSWPGVGSEPEPYSPSREASEIFAAANQAMVDAMQAARGALHGESTSAEQIG